MAASAISDETFAAPEPATNGKLHVIYAAVAGLANTSRPAEVWSVLVT